jgi:hypothetical protein
LWCVIKSFERKINEEAKKKQKIGLTEKMGLCSQSGVANSMGAANHPVCLEFGLDLKTTERFNVAL